MVAMSHYTFRDARYTDRIFVTHFWKTEEVGIEL